MVKFLFYQSDLKEIKFSLPVE